jgi:hypothetical protein
MDGKEKNGCREGVKKPELERYFLIPPEFFGEEEELKAQEYGPYSEAPFQDECQQIAVKMLAQQIERQNHHRNPGQVYWIDIARSFFPFPRIHPQFEPGIFLFRVEHKIIFFGVVVGHVDIFIVEEAVRCKEIIGFIPGKSDLLGDENKSAQVVDEKSGDEQDCQFFLGGKLVEGPDRFVDGGDEIQVFVPMEKEKIENAEKNGNQEYV